jgi:hypothetical protein
MALDDENFIESDNGLIRLSFNSQEDKEKFEDRLKQMSDKSRLVAEEGYKCGHCAAHPCYRHCGENDPAGLCFQSIRQCRQECDDYNYEEFPADGGVCKKLNKHVKYEQICIIEKERLDRLKVK